MFVECRVTEYPKLGGNHKIIKQERFQCRNSGKVLAAYQMSDSDIIL